MGDRTWVHLCVLEEDEERMTTFLKTRDYEWNSQGINTLENGTPITEYAFDEVNYGELPFYQLLDREGIPYTVYWGRGDDYGAGTRSLRFTPHGEPILIEISDVGRNPPIETLIVLAKDPEDLAAYVLNHHRAITPLPWDNQSEYGRLFSTLLLIGVTPAAY